jgi:hypothetical protein
MNLVKPSIKKSITYSPVENEEDLHQLSRYQRFSRHCSPNFKNVYNSDRKGNSLRKRKEAPVHEFRDFWFTERR